MRNRAASAAKIAVVAAVLGIVVPRAGRGEAVQTNGTGHFTSAQAKRGEDVYAEYCRACHGEQLTGVDEAAALTGSRFVSNWNRRTIGDLFARIRTTMPPGAPNQLTRQQTADVVAFLLSRNRVPAGPNELPLQLELLKRLELVLAPQ